MWEAKIRGRLPPCSSRAARTPRTALAAVRGRRCKCDYEAFNGFSISAATFRSDAAMRFVHCSSFSVCAAS